MGGAGALPNHRAGDAQSGALRDRGLPDGSTEGVAEEDKRRFFGGSIDLIHNLLFIFLDEVRCSGCTIKQLSP